MTSDRVDCCIAGAGPAGAMLALLLARRQVSVTLLEAQLDFRRDFRGDTIHPSTLETLDELGLADCLLKLPHSKIQKVVYAFNGERRCISDLTRVKTRYPYIVMLAQAQFLEFIVSTAKRYPTFRFIPGARVTDLIDDGGAIRGVRYDTANGREEVRAPLTIGADGRSSRVRKLANLDMVKVAPLMHVLWFRIPRSPAEPEEARVFFYNGNFMVALAGYDYWQLGKVLGQDHFQQVRQQGLRSLQDNIATVAPEFADRVDYLETWKQFSMLVVQPGRLRRWYRPGLLMIGDGAHVMSPVGGVGINYAIQDATVAANVLAQTLKSGEVPLKKLRAVQRRRELPIRIIQTLQRFDQRQIIDRALDSRQTSKLQTMLNITTRSALLQTLIARLMAIGIWREHVAT